MKRMLWVVSALVFVFCGSLAYAQVGQTSGPSFYGEFKPVVGGWSEYQITSKRETPMKMKIAVVGKEGDAYWYETVMEGAREGRTIMKMLVSGNPEDHKNVKRIIVKHGKEPAMEMPVGMMGGQQAKGREVKGKVIDKGTETIKVPAGTFKTQHSQYQDSGGVVDTWMYKDIAPYGMIKSLSKDTEMVLTGYGSGAKTQITETPKKFDMPAMPQMPEMPLKGK